MPDQPDVLDRWTVALAAALDLGDAPVPRQRLLDLARDAAHGVARPAAPLSTFLVGYAAGLRGGGEAALADAIDTALGLLAETAG
ncbi:hypothetical protein SAMN05443575_3995 [Jatrophihabitans endophyticus]|uniref:DUF6457 domain-containing protein n=1 Tax=Jatrophihabitans endophyticus TaxID=1206085 RepID=A0A1M5TEQ9_9ACTN|nr:DUF6457 domain-containing protein [Jatrophihabitans endophyticus]SHH49305.1 hypothetical protein SAMN05443575_3995 [Jatrophihabitans endophyticus]